MSVADLAGVRVIGAQARGVVWLRVLVRTFLAIVHVGLVIAVVASVKNVFASGDWNYSDGIPLYFILRARDGLLIYPDFQQLPYVTLSYWPLYIELVGLLSRFLTLSTYGTLYLARGVSLAGSLVVVAAIVGLARLCGARRTGALVGGGLFLLTYEYHPWAYAVRTDLLALGLIMAGTWTCLRWRTPRSAALAGFLLALGLCTKQSYVVAFGVLTLASLWRREWLRAAALVLTWGATVGLVYFVTNALTDGQFAANTVGANAAPMRFETILSHLPRFVILSLPLFCLSALAIVRGSPWSRVIGIVALYALVSGVAGAVMLARAGSNYNYLLETTALLCVLAGRGFDRCLRTLGADRAEDGRKLPVFVAVAALAVAVSILPVSLARLFQYAANQPETAHLIERIAATPGLVLTDHDALAVVLAGKTPVGGDPLGAALMASAGRWDPTELNELIASQSFDLIALEEPVEYTITYDGFSWWPPNSRELIAKSYELTGEADGRYLYTPIGRSPASPPSAPATP